LRSGSLTKKLANALVTLAPKTLKCSITEIGDLPLYNEDLDGKPPAAWARFRSEIKKHDAVLFLTPEYNRSIPGCLKNALDVGSRPEGKSVFDGLPAGVISVTPYKMGAFGANHALRQTFVFLNMPVMQQPEAYIGGAAELFGKAGNVKSKETRALLTKFMASFAHWVRQTIRTQPRTKFADFMKDREIAANAYVCGDPKPLDAITLQTGDASFFPPSGGTVRGAQNVSARYDADAKSFAKGSCTDFDVMQSGADGDFAFWTGLQIAEVRMNGRREKPVHMRLRITEVFRFQDGGWKLVHRHADTAAKESN
jgi:NAD(P)H-dependent FMN reductase/ketosteroid isomerase-like protein